MGIILWLVIGGVVGWLASIVMRRDGSQGIILNIVVGIVGAMLGGWLLGPLLGAPTINSGDHQHRQPAGLVPRSGDPARDRQSDLAQPRALIGGAAVQRRRSLECSGPDRGAHAARHAGLLAAVPHFPLRTAP